MTEFDELSDVSSRTIWFRQLIWFRQSPVFEHGSASKEFFSRKSLGEHECFDAPNMSNVRLLFHY